MRSRRRGLILLLICCLAAFVLSSCSVQKEPAPALPTTQAATQAPAIPTASPTLGSLPSPTTGPTPTIEHLLVPAEPLKLHNENFALDISTAPYGSEGRSYGDLFLNNRFERPFTGEEMDYVGYVDIRTVNFYFDDAWYYFLVYVEDDLPESSDLSYGVELDLDLDGRGEYLVFADLPESTKWSTDGVGVYYDQDGDVGGERTLFADFPDDSLTGYEVVVFLDGLGADPDLAWARRSPDYSIGVEIALRRSLFEEEKFLWSGWADGGWRDPARFEYNDRIKIDDAGHPFLGYAFYPVKELVLLDSTCRSWFGFTPTGDEPGLCQIADFSQNDESSGSDGSKKGSAASSGAKTGWCVPRIKDGVKICWSECYLECPDSEKVDECIPCELGVEPILDAPLNPTPSPGDNDTIIKDPQNQ